MAREMESFENTKKQLIRIKVQTLKRYKWILNISSLAYFIFLIIFPYKIFMIALIVIITAMLIHIIRFSKSIKIISQLDSF